MNCPNCHHENKDGAKYCNECGFPLSGRIAEVAAAVAETTDAAVSERMASSVSETVDPAEFAAESSLDASAPDLTQKLPLPCADKTADLSGIERLVDADYATPANAWRSGNTMKMTPVGEGSSRGQKQFRAPDSEGKKRRFPRKIAVAAIIVVLALAGTAFATYQMELWGGHVVPDVVGKSQADATYELERQGFSVRWTQVKSDDVEGKVLLSDPSAGSRREAGFEVVIHVSVARTVPDVLGLSKEDAAALFESEECEDVEYQVVKSDEAEGSVLAVDPAVGTKVKATTHIVVQVATPYLVPNVVGMTKDEAEAALADEGFAADVRWVYSEDVEEGQVISTDPEAESKLASGSSVVVNVAKSRARELLDATHSYFRSSDAFFFDGVTYEVDPDSTSNPLYVEYEGDGTVSYSIVGRIVETKDYLFFGTQTLYGDWEILTGTITWDDEDAIASSSAGVSRA